jgi:hypothetical protein
VNATLSAAGAGAKPETGGNSGDGSKDGKSADGEAGKDGADSKDADQNATPAAASPFKWSERSVDLLGDQINLSYEIFNLRLLLERALSDRLSTNGNTRVQAVIGIPISIDPPPYAAGCAATVEVRLTAVPAGTTGPSLVAMFPQQETYNTWGVDRKRFQISATGTAPAESLGGKASAQSDSSYLHRHVETVAIERESGANELIIAWQFRPIAGERTVSPGLRQMLAVLALSSSDVGQHEFSMNVHVRSRWQSWNDSTQTAGTGVGWRALISNRPTWYNTWGDHGNVSVPTTERLEHDLAPTIDNVEWFRVGRDMAAVVVTGTNFFAGTTLVMGDQVLDAEHGLTIKSERSLQIVVPIASLRSDALLNGRYGASINLITPINKTLQKMRIRDYALEADANSLSYRVTVWLTTRDGSRLNRDEFDKLPDPIVSINGKVVPDVLLFSPVPDDETSEMATVRVTSDYLPSSSVLVVVRWPFYGDDWTLYYQTYEPNRKVAVLRVSNDTDVSLFLTGPTKFDDKVTVIVDQVYSIAENGPLVRLRDDMLKLSLQTNIANRYEEFFVAQPDNLAMLVRMPASKHEKLASIDISKKPPSLKVGTGGLAEYTGTGLDAVTRVTIDGKEASFAAYEAGTSISIVIDSGLIAKSGKKDVKLETADGASLNATLLVMEANSAVSE